MKLNLYFYCLILSISLFLRSQPSSVDTSFNTPLGYTILSQGQATFASKVQSDGKIVTTGTADEGVIVVRYLENGLLDTLENGGSGFGTDGQGYTITSIGTSAIGYGLDIQASDGYIVVAGITTISAISELFVVRYTNDGLLDSSFNSSGIYTKEITEFDPLYDISGVAVQSDGNIVTSGWGTNHTTGINNVFVLGLLSDGTLNTDFGTSAGITFTVIGSGIASQAMTLQSDNKILLGAYGNIDDISSVMVIRYTANGNIDHYFGPDELGYTATALPGVTTSITTLSNDGIVIGGFISGYPYCFVARYNDLGYPDFNFGTSDENYVISMIPEASTLAITALALDPTNKIIATGYAIIDSFYIMTILRYDTDGALDTTFTSTGYLLTSIDNNTVGYTCCVQTNGKFIIGGQTNGELFLIRYFGGELLTLPLTTLRKYGYNPTYIAQFLSYTTYAQIITDSTVQTAALAMIESIIINYQTTYAYQPDFNYLTYLYLLHPSLDTARQELIDSYPESTIEIDEFFDYLNERIAHLSGSDIYIE